MQYLVNAPDAIQVASGSFFRPLDPDHRYIDVKDIAHALANLCRFGGHCRQFYSVAQHSVLVSLWCDPEDGMWGLLHDAAEAYLGDLSSPIKHYGGDFGEYYRRAEAVLLQTVSTHFGLPPAIPSSVHRADRWLLAAEARDLMGDPEWAQEVRTSVSPPLERVPEIDVWEPRRARSEFLLRYYQLKEEAV